MVDHPDITHDGGMGDLAKAIRNVSKVASRQATSNSGSRFVNAGNLDANGKDLGQGTIVAGAGGALAPWVNDTTAPGKPVGITVSSNASVINVGWGGDLEGGVPSDFSHLEVYVDGNAVGEMTSKGVSVFGPYDLNSVHSVEVSALDDAHDSSGNSKPNESVKTTPVNVTVSGAEVDPSVLGITITKSTVDASGDGTHKGDLWLKYDRDPNTSGASLTAEWWWDGSQWVSVPVTVYLDQLAARSVNANSAVIGLLAAGIITSGTFKTTDGRLLIDDDGITMKNTDGVEVARFDSNTGQVRLNGTFIAGDPNGANVTIENYKTDTTSTGAIKFRDSNGVDAATMSENSLGSANMLTIYTTANTGGNHFIGNNFGASINSITGDSTTQIGGSGAAGVAGPYTDITARKNAVTASVYAAGSAQKAKMSMEDSHIAVSTPASKIDMDDSSKVDVHSSKPIQISSDTGNDKISIGNGEYIDIQSQNGAFLRSGWDPGSRHVGVYGSGIVEIASVRTDMNDHGGGTFIDSVRFDRRIITDKNVIFQSINSGVTINDVSLVITAGIAILTITASQGNKVGSHAIGVLNSQFIPSVGVGMSKPAYNWATGWQTSTLFKNASGKADGALEYYTSALNQGGMSTQFIYPIAS